MHKMPLLAAAVALVSVGGCRSDTSSLQQPASPPGRRVHVDVYASAAAPALPLEAVRFRSRHKLADLYQAAGITLTVASPQPLPGADENREYSMIDIDNLRRSLPPRQGWHVAAIVLPYGSDRTETGMTFLDTRDTFVVFTSTLPSSDERMRTAAHELGHALHLFHGDAEGGLECCRGVMRAPRDGKTIMAQSSCVMGTDWEFRFSDAEISHLSTHRDEFVRPGKPYRVCQEGHTDACAR